MAIGFALIPAYQPDMRLSALAEELLRTGFRVVIVDDGSGAEYASVLNSLPVGVPVLTHEKNRGKGAAIKTGLRYIKDSCEGEHYTVVTMDSDGQHLPADALRVREAAEADPDALVLGVRNFVGKVPFRSRLGNGITSLVFRLKTGEKLGDTQTGLRGFSDRFAEMMMKIPGDRYEYEMNVLMTYAQRRGTLKQVPIETVYLNENRASHFHAFRDSIRIYRDILRFRYRDIAKHEVNA